MIFYWRAILLRVVRRRFNPIRIYWMNLWYWPNKWRRRYHWLISIWRYWKRISSMERLLLEWRLNRSLRVNIWYWLILISSMSILRNFFIRSLWNILRFLFFSHVGFRWFIKDCTLMNIRILWILGKTKAIAINKVFLISILMI